MFRYTVKLIKSSAKDLLSVFITNFLGFSCLCVFAAFSLELLKKMRDLSDVYINNGDLKTFLTAIIVMCAVIIAFVQWICILEYRVLFMQRRNFNISVKMEGISGAKLVAFYILESLMIQVAAVVLGCLISIPIYPYFAELCGFTKNGLTFAAILIAFGIHVVINTAQVAFTMKKLSKFNVVQEMRSQFRTGKAKNITRSEILSAVFGILIILASSWIVGLLGVEEAYGKYIRIGLMIFGAFFAFDLLSILLHKVLLEIFKKIGARAYYFSLKNILGYYGKVMPIVTTMAIGLMLCIGLNGMYETIRTVAKNTVTQNLYFTDAIIYEDMDSYITDETIADRMGPQTDNLRYCTSLAFIIKEGDKTNTITGINSAYYEFGERIETDLGNYASANFNNPDWDGIVLPDYMTTKSRIGEKYHVTILDKEIEFTIAGSFASNGFRGRYAFVGLPYLQKSLGAGSLVNAVYLSADDTAVQSLLTMPGVSSVQHITKKQIEKESYDNVVKNTQIITIASYVTFACSLFMLISFLVMTSGQNISDMARLRALGVNKWFTLRIYIYQIITILAEGAAMGFPMAYFFIDAGTHLLLQNISVTVVPAISAGLTALLLGVITIGSIVTTLFLCKPGLNANYTNYLREKME